MQETTIKCAACGERATGKFCQHCGAPLESVRCSSCEAPLSPGARFCHLCGTPTAGRNSNATVQKSTSMAGWIAVGLASVALVVVVATQFIDNRPAGIPAQTATPGFSPQPAVTDISSMTPRQRADRLFDRIMMADSRGVADTVAFFTPMALQAYAMLDTLDVDARYHVGLIQGLAGDETAVQAQADSIRAETPTHLMASMLDYTLATLRDDPAEMTAAYREFLANYPAEIGQTRPEYAAHQTALESFRQDAVAATGGSGS